MARKTRRRGKGGKRVRGTRRIGRIGRVRRSRGGSRRYNNEGGNPFSEIVAQVKNFRTEVGELGRNAYTQASAIGSNTFNKFTQPSAPVM